ncbi:hypothetical protein LRB11_05755 [Ectothiorhodospira haloalkaliphila]|uniref:hypothetical protein n=1 Tax=Ectothiorhodospira haloalkaliphila TaxID=421628 RepID=UPI001EE8D949|nr:hypothetical protein [Ectothiorhodospira haloalkaliphila]MCG5524436.1 hypothetical protein [Ectothiorhodospira haloalkaliphila]
MGQVSADEQVYQQIHLDVARNATDDFNPFHDADKWHRIHQNPFGGPIVLGFQMECLAEYRVTRHRIMDTTDDDPPAAFRNYQFTFAGVLRTDEPFRMEIKPTKRASTPDGGWMRSNRVVVRKADGLVLIGQIRDSERPLALPDIAPPEVPPVALPEIPDRSVIGNGHWFHKRKFMTNSNAKNLLSGSLARQADYFDELEDRVNYPDMFPTAMISCALLERTHAAGHDFYANPMVYTTHHFSVDQRLARRLRSADALHILVSDGEAVSGDSGGLGHTGIEQQRHSCLGLLEDGGILFRGEVMLAPLVAILGKNA